MKTIQIRGFKKPQQNTKLLIDHSYTPRELARIRYNQLFEQQILFKADKTDKLKQFLDKMNKFLDK
jgi:hypothetical protein